VGILLISPLGDLVRRRSLVLLLILVTATLSIGLAVTDNLATFQALSFIIAVCTVTPQIMIPLTADLAPESKRAASIAITLSGLMLGVLVARVLSGTVRKAQLRFFPKV
jgi:MFS family permease